MNHKFLPHTNEEIRQMLDRIGFKDLDKLYSEIPEEIRFKGEYDIPNAMSELEIRAFFDKLGKKNDILTCFAGGGVYDHYSPSAIANIVSRSEFLTSYTPYQAEISQGTLHYIFEFQSMMAELTGMDIANASMYEGTTATAEAMMVAFNNSKKADTILYSEALNENIIAVLKTYAFFHGVKLKAIETAEGATTLDEVKKGLGEGGIAGVIVQQPNRYGIIEDFTGFADACHEKKAMFIINSVAADLALLKTPGEWGADIAVGDIQSLGLPMSFGGPYAGYMCSTQKLMRKLPGRIVGQTRDNRGQRVFVLTLQAREQHIRRQKATSNICSNQSLMALYATIYMGLMGKEGIKEAAQLSYDAAHYLCEKLVSTGKAKLVYNREFFNEFLIEMENRDDFFEKAIKKGFLPGIKVDDNKLLIAVTEKRTKDEVDSFIELF